MTSPDATPGPAGFGIAPGDGERGSAGRRAWLGLAATFFAGFSAVSVRNFGGWDEWLIVSLTSKGITSFPYAHRPLALAWALPGALGLPATLSGYWIAHVAYLCLAGLVAFALARELAPHEPMLTLVCGAAALTWVPLDPHRLNPLNNLMYSGATLAALCGLYCLVLWARGRGRLVLGAGMVLALLAARSYEGTLGLLGGGSLVLLVALGRESKRPAWTVALPWALTVALAAALAAVPLVLGGPSYQVSGLGWDASPGGVATRLLAQLRWHLAPLVSAPPPDILSWRVLLALGAFAVASSSAGAWSGGRWERRRLLSLALAGLALAACGWGVMLLSPALSGPERMQGFSAPGVGLLLGSGACLAASALPGRFRGIAAGVIGAWIVAAGTAHTLHLQHRWDAESVYEQQARLLRGLVRSVPDVKEQTLIVLLDEEGAFPAGFTFRHAVEFLYSGRAVGMVPGSHDFLYPSRFSEDGVTSEPWPVIRQAWDEPVRRFRYGETVVVRSRAGTLGLVDRWPSPPLPSPGAQSEYAPRPRIVPRAALSRTGLLGPG